MNYKLYNTKQPLSNIDAAQQSAALLRTLAHNFRSLASNICSISTYCLDNCDTIKTEKQTALLQDMNQNSLSLLTLLDNLLLVGKLSDSSAPLTTHPEILEDILIDAIARLKGTYPDAMIQVIMPKEIIILPLDLVLIRHVFKNLLQILLFVYSAASTLTCTVSIDSSSVLIQLESRNPAYTPCLSDSCKQDITLDQLLIQAHLGTFTATLQDDYGIFIITLPLITESEASWNIV
ncbi:MAG: hypothetical protein RR238_04355 [Lachnospiraceae bacterium]